MKIKTKEMPYEEVLKLPRPRHKKPLKPSLFFRSLVRIAADADLRDAKFTYSKDDTERAEKGPYLILMNHSSFIDLEIVSKILYPKPYCIVCTSDGFVGKEWLMRHIGCIPTQKFVCDITLIRDMLYAIKKKKASILMYPEASYTFDGTATPLPRKLGALLKKLGVPVISIHTNGAFQRDPLYGGLRKRRVNVSADVSVLATREEIAEKSTDELDVLLDKAFTFDNFDWQLKNKVEVKEPFRADGLERILYKCASCGAEGHMKGSGTEISCSACGKKYTMDSLGRLCAQNGDTEFSHIPDWYAWERDCVRKEIEDGKYILDTDVKIGVMVDYKAIYMIGDGHLTHSANGFHLTGADGGLDYVQKPLASYGLYSDYYWYEIGDVICIGNRDILYYCFPKKDGVVAKTRIAAEELFKIEKNRTKIKG